eukprot:14066_5
MLLLKMCIPVSLLTQASTYSMKDRVRSPPILFADISKVIFPKVHFIILNSAGITRILAIGSLSFVIGFFSSSSRVRLRMSTHPSPGTEEINISTSISPSGRYERSGHDPNVNTSASGSLFFIRSLKNKVSLLSLLDWGLGITLV